jgi:sulfur-carrier protein
MRITVVLPNVLRQHAAGIGRLELDLKPDSTLRSALDLLTELHPALEWRLRDEQGALRRYVNLFVDGEECRRLAGADTPLRAGAEIQVIPSIAGG